MSDTSPSRSISETATLDLEIPSWRNTREAIEWFAQLRSVMKSIVYRYRSTMHKAMYVFEETDSTGYNDYKNLRSHIDQVWNEWRRFSCVIYFDFQRGIKHMKTPKDMARSYLAEMKTLRSDVRSILIEVETLRTLLAEIEVLMQETEEEDIGKEFPGLPEVEIFTTSGEEVTGSLTLSIVSQEKTSDNKIVEEKVQADTKEGDGDEEEWPFRAPDEIDPNKFMSVWTDGSYPGEIPTEIKEWLEGSRYQMVGPSRTIFWLDGYDDMVGVLDGPAYVLEDEIVACPQGCLPGSFLLDRYFWEEKVPLVLLDKYMRYQYGEVQTWPAIQFPISPQVTTEVRSRGIGSLYPNSRECQWPDNVKVVRVKHQKNEAKFIQSCRNAFDYNFFDQSDLLFRGLSLTALALSLVLFSPTIRSGSHDMEFGPAIYTTSSFTEGNKYAGNNGAIIVLKLSDYRELNVWKPDLDEWNHLVATWLYLPVVENNTQLPAAFKQADVIVGPVSADQSLARSEKRFPKQGDKSQSCFTSYSGCERLRDALVAIIYVES